MMDRLEIQIEVKPVPAFQMQDYEESETSAQIREKVIQARAIQTERFKENEHVHCNAQMDSNHLKRFCQLDDECKSLLTNSMKKLQLSGRAYDKILKTSRTIADLDSSENIQIGHLAEAISYRSLDKESWMENAGTQKPTKTKKKKPMIRYFSELMNVPASHYVISEQLQRRYHIIIEEYKGKIVDHVLSGIRQIIIRLPKTGYTQEDLIMELYKMHLRYIQHMHIPLAVIDNYHTTPLLHWSLDEHLFLQIADELEKQKVFNYLLKKRIDIESLSSYYQPVQLHECDIGAMQRSFSSKTFSSYPSPLYFHVLCLTTNTA